MEQDRIALYKFLSIGFTYPQEGFGQIIKKSLQLVSDHYRNLNKHGYRLSGLRLLKKGLKQLQTLQLYQWQAIYTSMFISNYPTTPLHPYESYYTEGTIYGNASQEVAQIYADCGLKVFSDKEFPDLVSFELEFAAFLIENSEGCKPVFKRFFFDHLFQWVPRFFEDTQKYEYAHIFYKGMASIGQRFLEKEKRLLKEFVDG